MNVTALDIAHRYVGVKEVPGTASNPTILAMLRLEDASAAGDEIAWCSAFVNWIAWHLDLPMSRSLAARSWLTVGRAVSLEEAVPGFDVVIYQRGDGPQPGPDVLAAPGHVNFFVRLEGDKVIGFGGNQGDSVSMAWIPRARVLGVRRLFDEAPAGVVAPSAVRIPNPAAASVSVAPPEPSSLGEHVAATQSLPTIGTTRGPDGSMTQLEGDVRFWLQKRAAGYRWSRFVAEFSGPAGRITRGYAVYLAWAPWQLVKTFMDEEGIPDFTTGLARYRRAHGDPQQLADAAWREFVANWEVTPS